MAGGVTGEIHYVDAGYNKVGMPDQKILLKCKGRSVAKWRIEEVPPYPNLN